MVLLGANRTGRKFQWKWDQYKGKAERGEDQYGRGREQGSGVLPSGEAQ
jgi:hypothetical protein